MLNFFAQHALTECHLIAPTLPTTNALLLSDLVESGCKRNRMWADTEV